MPVSTESVLAALRQVIDPDLGRDIVTLGFVKDVRVDGAAVSFQVELTTPACPVKDELQAQAESVVSAIPGVQSVTATMTARVRERQPSPEELLPDVKHVIAIASGRGGVGKSTVTVNLAIALARQGASVGILDADVYGPSVPMLMGCTTERPLTRDSKIMPIERHGVRMMSLGLLLEEGQAVLWRGPMVAGTVRQLLADVSWGHLDYLLVDLPPGTGDAPMSLAQLAPLTGVVIVTTPHTMAATIAGKSAALFTRLNTRLLGVIENMATFVCPGCGTETRIFAGLPGADLARELGTEMLGSIPIDESVGASMEQGVPSLVAYPERPQAAAFQNVAGRLAQEISKATIVAPAESPKFTPVG